MTDEALVRACVEGNMAAQKKLFDTYSRVMMGLCLRNASYTEEAEDLAQDGWIKVFERLKPFRFEGSLEGWIKRIMVNTSLDFLRRNKQLTQSIDDSSENHSSMQTDADAFTDVGPFDEPENVAEAMRRMPGINGFYGATSMERLPVERAIKAQVEKFTHMKVAPLKK